MSHRAHSSTGSTGSSTVSLYSLQSFLTQKFNKIQRRKKSLIKTEGAKPERFRPRSKNEARFEVCFQFHFHKNIFLISLPISHIRHVHLFRILGWPMRLSRKPFVAQLLSLKFGPGTYTAEQEKHFGTGPVPKFLHLAHVPSGIFLAILEGYVGHRGQTVRPRAKHSKFAPPPPLNPSPLRPIWPTIVLSQICKILIFWTTFLSEFWRGTQLQRPNEATFGKNKSTLII